MCQNCHCILCRAGLTRKQLAVLKLRASGLSTKETAWELRVSRGTVEYHWYKALQKLRLAGLTEAVHWAVANGVVEIKKFGSGK